jgi:hypothetical protein
MGFNLVSSRMSSQVVDISDWLLHIEQLHGFQQKIMGA